jgi:hypothetical protein
LVALCEIFEIPTAEKVNYAEIKKSGDIRVSALPLLL